MAKTKELAKQAKEVTAELVELLESEKEGRPPKREAKASTKATQKYQDKEGLQAASFKLHRDTVAAFKLACDAAGESQAQALTRLMAFYATDVMRVIAAQAQLKNERRVTKTTKTEEEKQG